MAFKEERSGFFYNRDAKGDEIAKVQVWHPSGKKAFESGLAAGRGKTVTASGQTKYMTAAAAEGVIKAAKPSRRRRSRG